MDESSVEWRKRASLLFRIEACLSRTVDEETGIELERLKNNLDEEEWEDADAQLTVIESKTLTKDSVKERYKCAIEKLVEILQHLEAVKSQNEVWHNVFDQACKFVVMARELMTKASVLNSDHLAKVELLFKLEKWTDDFGAKFWTMRNKLQSDINDAASTSNTQNAV